MLHVLHLWLLHGMLPGWVGGAASLSSAQTSSLLGSWAVRMVVKSVLILEVSYICRRKDHGK